MSTQKRKFELFQRLQALGFTYDEAHDLRRIEMTLQRWGEAECGNSNDHCSTGIERDETTGKPFRVISYHDEPVAKTRRWPVADREAGAKRRLDCIVRARNKRECGEGEAENLALGLIAYHQTDCRGCNLYLVRASDLNDGAKIAQVYTRGLAVCD